MAPGRILSTKLWASSTSYQTQKLSIACAISPFSYIRIMGIALECTFENLVHIVSVLVLEEKENLTLLGKSRASCKVITPPCECPTMCAGLI
jgi:hypothetical protein